MTVAQLIAWLQTQDQDATVEVLQEYAGAYYVGTQWVDFKAVDHAEYIDLRGNQFVPEDAAYKDSRTLRLGNK